MQRITLVFLISLIAATVSKAQICWSIMNDGAISLNLDSIILPYSDHIEMSGEQMSCVIRWNVDGNNRFNYERSLVFPMLRRLPNDTHASLQYRIGTDLMSCLSVNSMVPTQLSTRNVVINGRLETKCEYGIGKANIGAAKGDYLKPTLEVVRKIFPSTVHPLLCESYVLKNISGSTVTVSVPYYSHVFHTPANKGLDGSYVVRSDIFGSGNYVLNNGDSVAFSAVFQAHRLSSEEMIVPDTDMEYEARMNFVRNIADSSLVLETPDSAIDTEFRFAKIRATESIYRTKGGLMHGPGGESYYAALWCNDECEYVSPLYPFIGYDTGNESAINCYRLFSEYQNDEFRPIPSSIIAEGTDIWNGAGDRGYAAMIAHGAQRYLLARSDKAEAERLWPFIKWCLEYCHRKLNKEGVPESDSDELEGRFPAGDANLSTACLYYDGLVSATYLAPLMGEPPSLTRTYKKQAEDLRKAIGDYFGATVSGYETYRYYDGNDLLRSWICLPLCFGIEDRAEGTLSALFSSEMMTSDGILTEQGSTTFWDRATLYALRGAFAAGHTDEALKHFKAFSERRLLGTHVPYPVEAYPEGSQRHLSGESALYCRVITEGLFGIRPTGFDSFDLKLRLPSEWDRMALRHIKAFGGDFDIEANRLSTGKIKISVSNRKHTKEYIINPNQEIKGIKL